MKRRLQQTGPRNKRAKAVFKQIAKEKPRAKVLLLPAMSMKKATPEDVIEFMVRGVPEQQAAFDKAKRAFDDKVNRFPALRTPPAPKPLPDRAYACHHCGASKFRSVEGSTVCSACGLVVSCRNRDEGQACRNFASDSVEDRYRKVHYGPTYNPLFSSTYNSATFKSKVDSTVPTWHKKAKVRATDHVGATSAAYRDRAKRKAFDLIGHVCDAVRLPHRVMRRAKVLYAQHRNYVEREHAPEMVITVCIAYAVNNH